MKETLQKAKTALVCTILLVTFFAWWAITLNNLSDSMELGGLAFVILPFLIALPLAIIIVVSSLKKLNEAKRARDLKLQRLVYWMLAIPLIFWFSYFVWFFARVY